MGSSFSSEEDGEGVAEAEVAGSDSVFSPAREQGDGMERPPAVQSSGDGSEEVEASGQEDRRSVEASAQEAAAAAGEGEKVIRLPEAGLVLTKLPPIRDTVSLPPAPQVGCGWSARGHVTRTHDLIGQASPPILCQARLYPRGSYPPSHRRGREAKFVPYEPYRGAVAFMENMPGKLGSLG